MAQTDKADHRSRPLTSTTSGALLAAVLLMSFASLGGGQGRSRHCSYSTMEGLEGIYKATSGSEWRCGSPGKVCDQAVWVQVDGGEEEGGDGQVLKQAASSGKKGLAWSVGLGTPWRDGAGGVRLSVTNCCEWYGISCLSDGSIGAITLSGNALEGTIPGDSLSTLTSLQHLDLSSNSLTGTIPQELALLPSLFALLLHNNSLTGPIPASIANQESSIKRLVLSSNSLTGNIPPSLGSMPRLQHLILNNNKMTGTIPSELGNAPNLTHVYLFNNLLTGTVPPSLHAEHSMSRIPHRVYVNGNNQPHRISMHDSQDPIHREPRHRKVTKGKLEGDVKDWREDIRDETPEEASHRRRKMMKEFNRQQMKAFNELKQREGIDNQEPLAQAWWVGDEL